MTKIAGLKLPDPPPALQLGLIAPPDVAPSYVTAIPSNAEMELAAQCGVPQTAVAPPVVWHDDPRVMIAQVQLQAIAIVMSPRVGAELGAVAVELGRHVWRPPPLARGFSEAVEIVRRVRDCELVYRVGSWWEHVGEAVRNIMSRDETVAAAVVERRGELLRPTVSHLVVKAAGPSLDSWRASLADAGGGVLLTDAYDMLEALVAIRGLPDSVFAATGRLRSRLSPTPRETEDFAEALLRYADGGVVRVSAGWDLQPFVARTVHHAPAVTIRLDRERVTAHGTDAALLGESALPGDFVSAEMQHFARDVRSRATRERLDAILVRHLAVSAIAEAVYLSSRTGQPESPRRLYEAQKCEELIP